MSASATTSAVTPTATPIVEKSETRDIDECWRRASRYRKAMNSSRGTSVDTYIRIDERSSFDSTPERVTTVILSEDLSGFRAKNWPIRRDDVGTQRAMNRAVPSDSAKRPTVTTFHPRNTFPAGVSNEDATLEFVAEASPKASPVPATERVVSNVRRLIAIVVACLLVLLALVWAWTPRAQTVPAAKNGAVRVESDPPGARVFVDGQVRGTTPLLLELPAGSHALQVHEGSRVKDISIEVSSGENSAYHVEWAEAAPPGPAAATGSLSVTADVAGATVTVDGAVRGRAPVTISDLAPGNHEVVVRSGATSSRRSVSIQPGATASLVITGVPTQTAWGWISLDTPVPMQVLEGGAIVGTSEIGRILLSPGTHELTLLAEPFGFRQTTSISVAAGRQTDVPLTLPYVPISINALPWADVWIDGVHIGETPLAGVTQPIGDHEIVFRHPQLGEKRLMARVSVQGTPRISVDMRAR